MSKSMPFDAPSRSKQKRKEKKSFEKLNQATLANNLIFPMWSQPSQQNRSKHSYIYKG